MGLAQWIVLLVALQRAAELVHGERNTRRLRAAGAVEYGAGHYPMIVLLHGAWLAALWTLVPPDAPANGLLLSVYGLLQVGRIWVLLALGRFWTTRILTIPQAPLVGHGPYRFCRHPNYAIVTAEIAILPLAFGAWEIAALFSGLNAALLAWRVRVENQALSGRPRGADRARPAGRG